MFSLSIVLLISRLWRQIGISYRTRGIEKRFWRLIGIFSLFLKGFLLLALSRTGHSSLSRLFTLSSAVGEKQNRWRKGRAGVKQAAITGKDQKLITQPRRPIRWPFFAINYTSSAVSPGWVVWRKKGGVYVQRHSRGSKHKQWVIQFDEDGNQAALTTGNNTWWGVWEL